MPLSDTNQAREGGENQEFEHNEPSSNQQAAAMKPVRWARFLFLAIPALGIFAAGCGNFWQAPSTSTGGGGCTTNCTTATSGNFYILDSGNSPGIVGDYIDAGALSKISGSPWLVSGVPYSMAIAPNGSFLVVSTTAGVFSYPIANGTLGTGVTVSEVEAYAVQVDSTSSWILEAIPGNASFGLDAVPVDPNTGANPGNPQTRSYAMSAAGALATNQMVISGDDSYIFASLGAGGTVVVPFSANVAAGGNPLGGTGTVIKVAHTGGTALSIAVDPGTTPRLFYVGEALGNSDGSAGGLRVFNYSSLGTGTLTQAAGSPIDSGGLAPNYILPEATGSYVYVANGQAGGQGSTAGAVNGFTVTASTASTPVYTIAADTSTTAGQQPLGLAEDSTGTFVFEVGSAGSPYFDAYTFDTTVLGQLDSQLTATSASSSIAVVAAPN